MHENTGSKQGGAGASQRAPHLNSGLLRLGLLRGGRLLVGLLLRVGVGLLGRLLALLGFLGVLLGVGLGIRSLDGGLLLREAWRRGSQ